MSKQAKHFRRVGGAGTALALALAMAGCGSDGSSSPGSVDTVTMTIPGAVTSYDPALGTSVPTAIASWAMYDTLVSTDADGTIVPGLAESWDVTPTSATFKLKTGVTCSDGTELKPADVAASLARFVDPETGAPLRPSVTGEGTAEVTSDADSVTVTLSEPWSELLHGLSEPFTGIICPDGLKNPDMLKTESSGTGAWVAKSQVAGSSYTFSARQDYSWGAEYAKAPSGSMPETLVMQVVTDEGSMANLVSGDQVQIASFSGEAWSRFDGAENTTVDTKQFYDTWLLFNEAPGHPTADKDVRTAIAQALDRGQLNDVQSYGGGEVSDNLGQSTYECYDPSLADLLPKTDQDAASGVLDGVKLRVIGPNVLAGGDANTYILDALRASGADAELQNQSVEAWISEIFSGNNNWDVTLYVQGVPASSMFDAVGGFVGPPPPDGRNVGNVDNSVAAEAFTTYTTTSGTERCDALTKLQTALFEQMDVLPLASVPVHIVYADDLAAVSVKGYILPATIRATN